MSHAATSPDEHPTGFGIDIGGTGMKGGLVDLVTGSLIDDRERIDTPQPATPGAMAEVVRELVDRKGWTGPFGVTFPGVVRSGRIGTAANLDPEWVGVQADELFESVLPGTGRAGVLVLNDADAAGLAESRYGAAKDRGGVVIVLTFGTGIGSAIIHDGVLLPNTELGHLELDGVDAESRAAASARRREGLSWTQWAERVQRYLRHVERLLSPELIIVGGGASKRSGKWLPALDVSTEVIPAMLANNAGIAGAAVAAASGTG
jgi:polyphosphate glucokinase